MRYMLYGLFIIGIVSSGIYVSLKLHVAFTHVDRMIDGSQEYRNQRD